MTRCKVTGNRLVRFPCQDDEIIFRVLPFTANVEERGVGRLTNVSDVGADDFHRAKTCPKHQVDHREVAQADDACRVNRRKQVTCLLQGKRIAVEPIRTLEAFEARGHIRIDAVGLEILEELPDGRKVQIPRPRRQSLCQQMALVLDDIGLRQVADAAGSLSKRQELLEPLERASIHYFARDANVLCQQEALDQLIEIRRQRGCRLSRRDLLHFSVEQSPSAGLAGVSVTIPAFLRASSLIMEGSHGGSNTRSTLTFRTPATVRTPCSACWSK